MGQRDDEQLVGLVMSAGVPSSRRRSAAATTGGTAARGPEAPRANLEVYLVRSVERAAIIITALAEDPYPIGIVELSKRVRLSAGSVHRLLVTLISIGWVEQNTHTAKYRLGARMLGIGAAGLTVNLVVQDGTPYLARLAERTRHDALISTLVGARTVHLARVAGLRTTRAEFQAGLSHPAHAMADGKLLLAYLPEEERQFLYSLGRLARFTPHTIVDPQELEQAFGEIRAQGYAVDNYERFEDGRSVAVPVLGLDRQPRLAMVCVGSLDPDPEYTVALVQHMRSLCSELSDHLIQIGYVQSITPPGSR